MLVKLFFTRFEKIGRTWRTFTDKVSLKARELLIHCHLPSYEERYSQMEQILKAAVIESHYGDDGYDYRNPSYNSLKGLIDTRFAVFDVSTEFFYHWNGLAALEVYARRAYRAYQLMDVEYYTDKVPFMFSWNFYFKSINSPTISFAKSSTFSMRR